MSMTWKEDSERGSRKLIDIMHWIILHLGRPPARLVLYFIIAYYFLTAKMKRVYSRQFLQKVLDRPVTSFDVFKHLLYFGSTLLDRVYMATNRKDILSIEVVNAEIVSRYVKDKKGCLLLGSHLGSFDLLRFLAQQNQDVALKIVIDKEPSQYITQRIYSKDTAIQSAFINANDADGIFKIQQALQQGDIVGMLGDRIINQQRSLRVPFLKEQTQFPTGPLLLACLANVPVILFFGIYLGGNRYKIIFELFEENFSLAREKRRDGVDAYVRKYVERLEYYARTYPYNWFNFYEYWKND